MKYIAIAIISILFFAGCDARENKVYNAFKCAEAATYQEDHTKAQTAIINAGPHFKDDGDPNDPNFWMQLDEKFQKEYKFDVSTTSKQMDIMSTLYESSECKKWYGTPEMPDKNDEVYNAFKCAEAATYLDDKTNAEMAILNAGPHFKDDDDPNDPDFWMKLDEKFQKEYKFDLSTTRKQIDIMSTLYESSECKKWYGTADMSDEDSVIKLFTTNTAHSFEEIFHNFDTCDLPKVSYDIFKEETTHPYFIEANIKPYKVAQSLAFYSVSESLYGMPVSEIILPVTWSLTSVTFDFPIDKVRPKLEAVFGKGFEAANKSEIGYKPVLIPSSDDPSKTDLYCDEPDYE